MLLERFVAIDLETTGGDPHGDRILEIGAVRFERGQEVAARSWLCDPGRPIPLRFQHLTGITPDQVRGCPPAEAVLPEVLAFAAGAPLVAYNAPFDAAFLAAACRRAGLAGPGPVLDGAELARLALPRQRSYRLAHLARALGIPQPRAHRAEDDARALGMVFLRCLDKLAQMELAVLLEILRLTPFAWPLRDLIDQAARRQETAGVRPRPAAAWIAPAPGSLHGPEPALPQRYEPIDPDEVEAILGPGGPLARALSAAGDPAGGARAYEHRPQQVAMARQVAEALNSGRHLLVEAGTGTGKSLAYLVPALLWARQNGDRVVIATHTITLQEQLWEKDIPTLIRALGWDDVQVALVKGRNNYVCLRKWEEALQGADLGTSPEERLLYARTVTWLAETETGDRAEVHTGGSVGPRSFDEVWAGIQSEAETCLGPRCKWFQRHCFAFRARQRARAAQVLVVNHALLLADLQAGGGVIPRYQHLILDEAHHLEEVATQHLGIALDQGEVAAALAHLFRGYRSEAGPGLLPQVRRKLGRSLPAAPPVGLVHEDLVDKLVDLVLQARSAWEDLGAALGALAAALGKEAGDGGEGGARSLRLTPALRQAAAWEPVAAAHGRAAPLLRRLGEGLALLAEALADLDDPRPPDLDGLAADVAKHAGLIAQAAADLDAVLLGEDEGTVYWVEVGGARQRWVRLRAAPVHVGPLLREQLFERLRWVVLTSATLTVEGSFAHILQRLGLADLPPDRVATLAVPSPFRYREQALVLVPADMPDPQADPPAYTAAVSGFLREFLVAVGGRTLVLFTSHRQLRQVYNDLKVPLEAQGLLLLAQGVDGGRSRLVEEFRLGDRAVLFGSASFWEGVDIPGDDLACVVMVRLPFAPPDDPVQQARTEDLERRGLSAFFHLSLPQAVIRFKQGFGRLIRTAQDRGVMVILDQRVHHRRYGPRFLQSLPGPQVAVAPRDQVVGLAARFLHAVGGTGSCSSC